MSSIAFDKIIKSTAPRKRLQPDWERQFAAAAAIAQRFADGYDTVLLADEVGMGKSYVALAAMTHYLMQSRKNDRRVLLVAPSSPILLNKWMEEIGGFQSHYLHEEFKGKVLRPVIVGSYWELFRILHDHESQGRQRVAEECQFVFIKWMYEWALSRQRLKRALRTPWPALAALDDMLFAEEWVSASFSKAAAFQFFDEHSQDMAARFDALFQRLAEIKKADAQVSDLFKCFAAGQDAFEPNIFVVGTRSLGSQLRAAEENERFAQFMMGFLLKFRRSEEKEAVLRTLERAGVLPAKMSHHWQPYFDEVLGLADTNMHGMGAAAERAVADPAIAAAWEQLRPLLRAGHAGEDVKHFFNTLRDCVFQHKLAEANIGLAVIDEVHNWKGGKNGAGIFKKHLAPAVPCKLMMSATPFQVEEGELQAIFNYVGTPGGKSRGVLQGIFDGADGMIEGCLRASARFAQAWHAASGEATAPRTQDFFEAVRRQGAAAAAASAAHDLGSTPETKELAAAIAAYRSAISVLQGELGKVVIRHTKPRDKRNFRIGDQFRNGHADRKARPTLYASKGYTDNSAAFVNFVGMRLGQIAARSTGGSREANARLLRGLSSSTAAFLSSRGEAAGGAYAAMFEAMLEASGHPKVELTVQRAYANYLEGKKTLIFCERRATLDEIARRLQERLAPHFAPPDSEKIKRNTLLKRADFLDNPWALSLLDALGQPLGDADVQGATAFVQRSLAGSGARPSARRLIRLLDAYLIGRDGGWGRLAASRWPQAAGIFQRLYALAQGEPGAERDETLKAWLNIGAAAEADGLPHEELEGEVAHHVERLLKLQYRERMNLWCAQPYPAFHEALWNLLESEARRLAAPGHGQQVAVTAFLDVLGSLVTGLRYIALRDDLLNRYEREGDHLPDHLARIGAGFASVAIGHGETMLARTTRFLTALGNEDGSISRHDTRESKRKSMWSGVSRPTLEQVTTIHGDRNAEFRIAACAAFNSPLLPDILVCSAIGSEGIDLHRHCAEIIHHDLPWNPAKLEQRIGRLDRVDSLADPKENRLIEIGIPFLANDYEQFQYAKLHSRAQKFEILLGAPDFDVNGVEEELFDDAAGKLVVRESEDEALLPAGGVPLALPDELVDYLKMDLSVWRAAPAQGPETAG